MRTADEPAIPALTKSGRRTEIVLLLSLESWIHIKMYFSLLSHYLGIWGKICTKTY